MPATYREMRLDDLPATLAVRLSTIENAITLEELESEYGITPESMAVAMGSDLRGWLCEESGKVVGFAMGDRSNGEVQVVAVHPEHEGKGIGMSLLSRVQSWLFSQGHDAVWLLSNPNPKVRAHGFYRKLGWRPSGQRKGEDEVLVLRKGDLHSAP